MSEDLFDQLLYGAARRALGRLYSLSQGEADAVVMRDLLRPRYHDGQVAWRERLDALQYVAEPVNTTPVRDALFDRARATLHRLQYAPLHELDARGSDPMVAEYVAQTLGITRVVDTGPPVDPLATARAIVARHLPASEEP